MRFRRLVSTEDLDAFREGFREASGINIPLDYFQAASVTGLYRKGRLVGGYSLRSGDGMRWLDHIPVETEFQRQHPPDTLLELNGLWLDRACRQSWVATLFWLYVGWDLGRRKGYTITFVVDPRKPSLVKLYEKAASGLVYEGDWVRSSLPRARLYWSHPTKFRYLLFPYLWDLLRRAWRGPD